MELLALTLNQENYLMIFHQIWTHRRVPQTLDRTVPLPNCHTEFWRCSGSMKNVVRKNKNAKFIFISTIAAIKSRKKNYIYGISKSLTEKYIKNSGFNFLILRFGKIKTEMSESHNKPPFTLDKFEAGMLIHKHIESNGIVYPTIGLKVSAMFIKLLPLNVLDYIEKNIKK